jgi:NAD-dependent deacetylase
VDPTGDDDGKVGVDTLDEVATWLLDAGRVVALTGAGVSTASGIPDYRGPEGVWTKDPAAERLASIEVYVRDDEVRREVWRRRAGAPTRTAQPNAAHRALVDLERLGHLHTLITQNVDGLHQAAGSSPERLIEVHGTVHEVLCLACGDRGPMTPVLDRVLAGDDDPRCQRCGGLLKSATISFGESLDPAVLQRAHDATFGCEVFLALGTSLVVHPVALLPRTALEVGARLIVANAEETPYDEVADVVLRDDLVDALPELVSRIRARAA